MESVLRLGVDPRPGVRGMREFDTATSRTLRKAWEMDGVLAKLAVSFGALAAANAAGKAIRSMIEFDSAMTQSLSIMGEVSDAMRGDMASAARQVAVDLNFAASEGAEAFFFLASAGLDAKQSIAALPAVAEFARAGMFDFATATDLATDAQSALGLTSADAQKNLEGLTRVTDVLVKANTIANASVQQFAESLTNRAAAALRNANREVEEGAAVLAAYADQGTKGRIAGEMLSRMMRILAQGAKNSTEEFTALGLVDASGNLTSLANVVEIITRELEGLSDVQRTARLEQLGFASEAQEAINPLLGMSDAIRGYEENLRAAGGATKDVADNQMESLKNQIGQIQQEFANWRVEMAEKAVPAIQLLIDNAETLTDIMVGLGVAVGGAGLALAFTTVVPATWGTVTAFAALVPAVNSLGAAFALLQVAIGPAGWVALGLSAIVGATVAFRRASREAAEAVTEQEAALAKAAEEMGNLGRAATLVNLQQFAMAAQQTSERLHALKEELEGQQAWGRFNKDAQETRDRIRETEAELEGLEGLLVAAATAWTQYGEESGPAAENPNPGVAETTASIGEQIEALGEQITLYERSLAVQNRVRESLLANAQAQAQILGILQSGQATWEEEVDLLELSAQAANTFREELLKLGPAGMEAARAILDTGLMEFPEALNEHVTKPAEESAWVFRDEWLTAINVVAGSLGGLASQVANIVTSFATGGLWAGGASLAGALIGSLNNGRSRIADMEAQREVAAEAQRAADALRDFTRAMEDDLDIRAAMNAGNNREAARLRLQRQHDEEWEEFFEGFFQVFPEFVDMSEEELQEAFAIWAQLYDVQSEEMQKWLDLWLQRTEVHAGEMDQILNDLTDIRRKEADAAREAARALEEANRAYEDFINTVLSLTQRIANLRGDRVGSLKAGQAMELFNLPDDTSDTVRELIGWIQAGELAELERDLLLQEVNEAMEADLAAIREAADAQIEAIRKAADEQMAILEEQAKVVEEQLKVARAGLQAQEEMVRSLSRVVQALSEALDEMLLGPMSPLDPISQLMEARRQFENLTALAMGGDAGAAQGLPGAMQALLAASDAVNATGPGYVEDFERSRDAMETIRDRFADQLTVEEQILEELRGQTQHLQAQVDSLRAQRDAIQQAAQQQIGAIRDQAELQMAAVRDAAMAQIAQIHENHAKAMDWVWKQIGFWMELLQLERQQAEDSHWIRNNMVDTSHGQGEGTNFVPTFRSESRTQSSGTMTVVDPVAAAGLAGVRSDLGTLNNRMAAIERNLANVLAGG